GEAGNEIPTTMYPEGREHTLMSGDLSSAIQSALAREVHGQIDSGEPAQEHDQQDELEQTEVVPLLGRLSEHRPEDGADADDEEEDVELMAVLMTRRLGRKVEHSPHRDRGEPPLALGER